MEPKKNLCAQIPVSLHTRIRQEQEESGKSLSEFMTELLTNYYENGGNRKMDGKQRTVAFQVPEELFEQFKEYLKQHNMKQNASSWTVSGRRWSMSRNHNRITGRRGSSLRRLFLIGGVSYLYLP